MPNNNILKEIKNELISKGDEPRVDNLEQYISQNKIFTILFFSKIIPDFESVLSILNSIYQKFDNLKLIICICEETEEEFNQVLSCIKEDITCLILKYESKNREILISNYNIISLPTLLILDKNGALIDSLNIYQIINLQDNDIKGWINKIIISNIMKYENYELGQTIKISAHRHELVFSNTEMKGYSGAGWRCDLCRKSFGAKVCNFNCFSCGWDICEVCLNKYKDEY